MSFLWYEARKSAIESCSREEAETHLVSLATMEELRLGSHVTRGLGDEVHWGSPSGIVEDGAPPNLNGMRHVR